MAEGNGNHNARHGNYLATQVLSATPEGLILIVYEGIIRYANMARLSLHDRNYEKVNDSLKRCFGLTTELLQALRFDTWEGAGDLARLYEFVVQEFLEANIDKQNPEQSVRHIDAALSVITELHAAWKEGATAARQARRGAAVQAKG